MKKDAYEATFLDHGIRVYDETGKKPKLIASTKPKLKKVKRKGKRLPHTPSSQIRAALRKLFLYSREHRACLKNGNKTCVSCGAKGTSAKGREVDVRVHHLHQIDWEKLFFVVRETLLCPPEKMVILCKKCHDEVHELPFAEKEKSS